MNDPETPGKNAGRIAVEIARALVEDKNDESDPGTKFLRRLDDLHRRSLISKVDRDSLSRLNDLFVTDHVDIGRWLGISQEIHRTVVEPVAKAISDIAQVVIQWEADILNGKYPDLDDTPHLPDILVDTIDAAATGSCAFSQRGDWMTAFIGAIAGAVTKFSALPLDAFPSNEPIQPKQPIQPSESIQLAPMKCRDCDKEIQPRFPSVDRNITVTCFDDCYWQCSCGAGYSNARNKNDRVKIFRSPELNVPLEVRDGLIEVLENAVNIRNRKNKINKFASERSEDAWTWTVFQYLLKTDQLDCADGDKQLNPLACLFWGVPNDMPRSSNIAVELAAVSMEIGERSQGRTEPDVVLAGDNSLYFIEVKNQSENTRQPNYPEFDKYLDHAIQLGLFNASRTEVKRQGHYQLTRNWVIGNLLARRLNSSFKLINLAPETTCCGSAAEFKDSLALTKSQQFVFRCRDQLLRDLKRPLHTWFQRWLDSRSEGGQGDGR